MMVDLFGVERDPRQEGIRFRKSASGSFSRSLLHPGSRPSLGLSWKRLCGSRATKQSISPNLEKPSSAAQVGRKTAEKVHVHQCPRLPIRRARPARLEKSDGTAGFESSNMQRPRSRAFARLFTRMGFPAVARHKRRDVTLHRPGDSTHHHAEPDSFESEFAAAHVSMRMRHGVPMTAPLLPTAARSGLVRPMSKPT